MACCIAVCPPVADFWGNLDIYFDLVSGTSLSRCMIVPLADTGGNFVSCEPHLPGLSIHLHTLA